MNQTVYVITRSGGDHSIDSIWSNEQQAKQRLRYLSRFCVFVIMKVFILDSKPLEKVPLFSAEWPVNRPSWMNGK